MNRRDTLGIIGAGLLGVIALEPASAAATPAAPKLDPASAKDAALVFRKLAWCSDGGFGIWWLKGRRFAAIPPVYTPFWDMLIGTLFTVRDIDADTYAVTTLTTSFYTDVKTGQFLENFHNPITGKDHKVTYLGMKPIEQKYGLHGQMVETPMNSMAGATTSRSAEPGPFVVEGDDVWIRSDNSFRAVPNDVTRQAFQVEDLSTYFGSLKDLNNPKLKLVPAGQVFTDLLNYPAWLEMGDRNGHFFSRCFGRKTPGPAAMPQDWQRLMAEHHPEILKDPLAALKG